MRHAFLKSYERLLSLNNLQLKQFSDSKTELRRSMKRLHAFLTQIGNPEEHLDFIHITGTSGKGSVANMIHQILVEDGQKVGTYTSPHTTSFLQRFKLQRGLMDPHVLKKHLDFILNEFEKFIADGDILSFFELSTCLAIYTMKKAGVDWCILEAGCGGRWDATNIIPRPVVGIITNINKDHTDILGDSLSQIAFEKAGIIKKGSTVLCGESRSSLKKIFTKEAIKKQAALFFVPPSNKKKIASEIGWHQQHNAILAERATKEIGVQQTVIDRTFKKLRSMPCRFETIQKKPHIIIDGAHSPAKIASTVERIKKLKRPVHIIFGCAANKDKQKMIKHISTVAVSVTTTRFTMTQRKAANPAVLLTYVPKTKQAGYFLDPLNALKSVKEKTNKDEIIIITGSLFLAGELRAYWIPEEKILKYKTSFPI